MKEYQDLKIEHLISEDRLKETFKVERSTIKRWRSEKGLPCVRLGNKLFVLEQDFMEWVMKQREMK